MTVNVTTGLRGVEDLSQAAAGGTFSRTRNVNGTSTTGNITKINASNFPILATADATAVTNGGGAATYPGPAITELANRVRAGVDTVANMRAWTTTPTAYQLAFLLATGAVYYWNSTSTATDDGATVIKQTSIATGRWIELNSQAGSIATGGNNAPIVTLEAIGSLAGIGLNYFDYQVCPVAFTISKVVLLCPSSSSSGTITVDLLKQDTSGVGSPSSLYSVTAKPTLTCNGGIVWATYTSGAGFPDTIAIPAGALLAAQLSGTIPAGSEDLKVLLY